jgi:hypothetical protein
MSARVLSHEGRSAGTCAPIGQPMQFQDDPQDLDAGLLRTASKSIGRTHAMVAVVILLHLPWWPDQVRP